ncbi:MAG: DUF1365 domain-containing protein [Woeseiaceae bacterium]
MKSCIYEGQVRHTRSTPVLHRFKYRLFMMYLDLDELSTLFEKRWFWSTGRWGIARFRRSDHLGPESQPLSDAVRDRVAQETGVRPTGPIRLLTNMRYFGHGFNPVSFYYCFSDDDETLESIVAEVNNTPWGEQDTYVLPISENIGSRTVWRFQPTKKLHVSPFMPMDVRYDWRFSIPSERMTVFMANAKDGKRFFNAAIEMRRTEISGSALARVLATFPLMTVKVVAAIYWQAMRLWLKRCPLYVHPDKKKTMMMQKT